MISVIYGDVLLLIDFCMNFFVLYTTGIILRRRIKKTCIISAALLGGVYSVAKIFLEGNDIFDCIISFSVGLLISYICFGGYKFLKTVTVFYVVAALVGGLMMCIYYLLGSYHTDIYGYAFEYAYSHLPVWLFIILAAISMAISWAFAYWGRDAADVKETDMFIEHHGRKVNAHVLLDSGNLVKEPISDKYVVLIGREKAKELFDAETYDALMKNDTEKLLKKKFRIVPVTGIEGKRLVYFGMLPEKFYVMRSNREIEVDAYIAVCNTDSFTGHDGIAHPALFG